MGGKVTVVIPLHGNPEWFSESLESVLGQTYSDIEIIAIGSTSINKLNEHKYKVIYLETGNASYGFMISEALKVATGDLIAFMNEGDIFSPAKIELQVKAFNDNPDVGLVITAYQIISANGSENAVYIPGYPQQDVLFVLLYGHIFGKSTAMIRRECYQHIEQYNLMTELDAWIQIVRHCKVRVINKPLVKQRIHLVPPSNGRTTRRDTQRIISDALASIPLEEIFPGILPQPDNSLIMSSACAVKGAILMRHRLYEKAMDSFTEAHRLYPDSSIPLVWIGILSLHVKDYQTAVSNLAKVPKDDRLYLDAQWILTLVSEAQVASPEVLGRINVEMGKQYNSLLQITLDLSEGKDSPDVVEDVQLYLNWDISQAFKALFDGTMMIADEWNSKSPQTPDKIIYFYKQTDNYIFDLAWWHRDPARRKLTETAISICKQNNVQKVLDFGCGIGQDGILFSKAGFDVTLADLPGKTFDFAKWRVERRNLDIKTINSDELSERYDVILCFDVLEHVWEPKDIVEYLYGHLVDQGIILVTVSFEHNNIHPLHLERNARYIGRGFLEMMSQAGFQLEKAYGMLLVFRISDNVKYADLNRL